MRLNDVQPLGQMVGPGLFARMLTTPKARGERSQLRTMKRNSPSGGNYSVVPMLLSWVHVPRDAVRTHGSVRAVKPRLAMMPGLRRIPMFFRVLMRDRRPIPFTAPR